MQRKGAHYSRICSQRTEFVVWKPVPTELTVVSCGDTYRSYLPFSRALQCMYNHPLTCVSTHFSLVWDTFLRVLRGMLAMLLVTMHCRHWSESYGCACLCKTLVFAPALTLPLLWASLPTCSHKRLINFFGYYLYCCTQESPRLCFELLLHHMWWGRITFPFTHIHH